MKTKCEIMSLLKILPPECSKIVLRELRLCAVLLATDGLKNQQPPEHQNPTSAEQLLGLHGVN